MHAEAAENEASLPGANHGQLGADWGNVRGCAAWE